MRLYYTPGTCSQAPHIVAREAGIDLDLVRVDLATKQTEDGGDYLVVNPKGGVPALVLDDGFTLTEAAVLIQYLADLAPKSELFPAGGRERYEVLQWLNFIATELHKGFGPLWNAKTPPEMRELVKAQLAGRFGFLDRHLAKNDYLVGGRFGVSDAYAFTILGWAKFMSIDLGRWANLTAWLGRIAAREKVREALIAEGLLEPKTKAA